MTVKAIPVSLEEHVRMSLTASHVFESLDIQEICVIRV